MNKVLNKIKEKLNGKLGNENRMINVRFPSFAGDENRQMTVQQLKEEYENYLIFDPSVGEQVDLEKLANLEDVNEVVAIPPVTGG